MRALNLLPTELVMMVVGYLQGEELPLALTNTRLLRIAREYEEPLEPVDPDEIEYLMDYYDAIGFSYHDILCRRERRVCFHYKD